MTTACVGDSILLTDGRTLGYRELGTPGGKPMFFFHGTPGSRLTLSATDPIATIPGVHLVAPERPGYGLSSPKPMRTLLDWARDVVELADHLRIDRFAVCGASGGGPHALACAHALGDRVRIALVLCSPSPAGFPRATRGMAFGNRLGLALQRHAPGLMRRMQQSSVRAFAKNPNGYIDAIARQMPPEDRQLMADPAIRDAVIRDLREAYRQGADGHMVDGALAMTASDWGFDLHGIAVPVHLWHGERDRLVTTSMFRHLASSIPGCVAHSVAGAGHLLDAHPSVIEGMRLALDAAPG